MTFVEPISPSRLAVEAAGHAPLREADAASDGICCWCAVNIWSGDPIGYTRSVASELFNNKADSAATGSPWICGWCLRLTDRVWMEKYSKCLATRTSLRKLGSNGNQAHFILSPPEPPFVAWVADGKMQHLIWRSSVTYDRRRIQLRFGDRQLEFDPAKVVAARDAALRLGTAMNMTGLKGRHPYQRLSRDLQMMEGAAIRADVLALCWQDATLAADARLCEQLTLGELWAVGTLLNTDAGSIAEPPPVNSSEEE